MNLKFENLDEKIRFFASKCRNNGPALCLKFYDLAAFPLIENFVNSIRLTKIYRQLMLEGDFVFEKRDGYNIDLFIKGKDLF